MGASFLPVRPADHERRGPQQGLVESAMYGINGLATIGK
jgi:hypothetical protein